MSTQVRSSISYIMSTTWEQSEGSDLALAVQSLTSFIKIVFYFSGMDLSVNSNELYFTLEAAALKFSPMKVPKHCRPLKCHCYHIYGLSSPPLDYSYFLWHLQLLKHVRHTVGVQASVRSSG